MLVSQLIVLLEEDYRLHARRSFLTCAIFHWRHVERLLGKRLVSRLTPADINRYGARRLEEGAARGSVNIQLALLRRGLKLALRLGHVDAIPHVPALSGQTVREGFVTAAQFRKVHATLEALDPDAADVTAFLYASGWRRSEALGLRWEEVGEDAIHLSAARSKTKKPRTIPLVATLREVIERRREKRRGPFVFHRRGREIRSFRGAWRRALNVRGLDGTLVHDLRRSFARNCLLARVSREQAMAIGGWASTRVWARYAIVDEALLVEALQKVSAL